MMSHEENRRELMRAIDEVLMSQENRVSISDLNRLEDRKTTRQDEELFRLLLRWSSNNVMSLSELNS